jgi:hypothetical protein
MQQTEQKMPSSQDLANGQWKKWNRSRMQIQEGRERRKEAGVTFWAQRK